MRRLLVALLVLLLAGCASTHHVMLGQTRPAIDPAQVKVYQVPPKRYEEVARLDAKSAVGFGTQGQINAAIDRLAREAAKLGANGVILLGVDQTGSPVSLGVGGGTYGRHSGASVGLGIPTAQQRAEGIAIYVIEE
ncbi:hypothetical protein [Lysobacter sp. Root494]|uniref:hypothetical protein n=1 Tax=Lysobacter sp. Root494 TaxID=1736549 RepID=UPI0006F2D81B|nr:hypothetical protein [Lysobacter sp. Root494]KQY54792.1 hypothetical protein ASD14_01000 [Lysobacter sp. Root494]